MRKKQNGRMGWLGVLLVGAVWLLAPGVSVASTFDTSEANQCIECHKDAVNNFQGANVHFKAWQFRKDDSKYSCSTCHGPGEKHIKDKSVESIISFAPEKVSKRTSQEQAAQCLTCHSTQNKELMFWKQGAHNRNDVSCASCHTMHGGTEKMKPTSETCFKCHKDVKSQLNKFSHHPIIEGKVSCNDCHNPHGTMSDKNLRAENVNQLCYKCHTDKRGPFLYEHPPVAENCMNCHRAHGSQHAKLLTVRMPSLCQSCHADSGHPSTPFDLRTRMGNSQPAPVSTGGTPAVNSNFTTSARFLGRSCVNCHNTIHGSNQPGHRGKVWYR